MTTDQIRNQTKTVTRRLGWRFLKPGDILNACVKCQGLKKGEKVERICQIRVISVERVEIREINTVEVPLEGFPDMDRVDFINMFCKMNNCNWHTWITRIEFEYLEEELPDAIARRQIEEDTYQG